MTDQLPKGQEPHGTLKEAHWHTDPLKGRTVRGRIYGDTKGRFYDGEWIVTSTVLDGPIDGLVFTRFSVYRVEWADPVAAIKLPATAAADINAMVAASHGKSKARGWWVDKVTGKEFDADNPYLPFVIGTKLMLSVSELAEGMEGHRKGLMDDKLPDRTMLEVELADTLIRVLDLAGFLGLDLGGAYVAKTAFNDNRPDHKAEARAAAGGKGY